VVAVLTALAFVGVGAMALVHAQGSGGALFGRAYLSKKVIKNGAPHTLVEGTKIRVKFEHRDNYDVVRWRSGCNRFGAHVEVMAERLKLGVITGTLVGCPKPLDRQDEWIASFFASDPEWVRNSRKLRLRSADDVIKLRRRA
jgi:heat shock protein HslJ